jgi:gamma-glutamyltranspeptidase/glutathione hydrolase/leukotriene-C4 hydrolase
VIIRAVPLTPDSDEMADFSKPDKPDPFGLRPSPYNYPIGPPRPGTMGKRPLSSTSASIIESDDGRFILAIGGSGGSRIFGAVVQTLLLLDWGYDLQHAVEEPRVHNQLLPAYVRAVRAGLSIRGADRSRSRWNRACR